MTWPLWLLKAGSFLKSIPWQVWAAIALLAGVWFYGERQFDSGYQKRLKEEAIELQQARDEIERLRKAAEVQDTQTKQGGEKVITERREKLDAEKQGVPDGPLTERQRIRGCGELRRQGQKCPTAESAR